MRFTMFMLVAALVFPTVMRPGASPTAQGAPPPGEAGVKQGAAGKEEREVTRVVVTSPMAKDVVVTEQFACQIRSRQFLAVRSLMSGYLEEILVKEGQAVKQGQVLFRIDPAIYKARLDAEQADVRVAQLEFENVKKLANSPRPVVSQQEVAVYEAKLAKAQARAKLAEAELAFTTVKAPFDGLVGRLLLPKGSLVKGDEILTTLSDNSTMWVYFNVPEARYLELKAREGKIDPSSRLVLPDSRIELVLAGGHKFDQNPGNAVTVEASFNSDTGSIAFRADFPNPERLLRNGQTGTIRIHRTVKNAIVIPQRATFEILDRRYVYVMGQDHVVHARPIVVEHEVNDVFVINKGLDVNDRIVLEGIRQIVDGQKVEFEFVKPETVIEKRKAPAE